MPEITPQEILALNLDPTNHEPKRVMSNWWIVFWLVVFTPAGIWQVVKSDWSIGIKVTVCILASALFLFLTYESITLTYQISTSALPQ